MGSVSTWQLTPSHEGRQCYVLSGMVRPCEIDEIETLTAALFKGKVNHAREKYVYSRPAWPVDFPSPAGAIDTSILSPYCRREKRKSAQKLVIKMHSFFR